MNKKMILLAVMAAFVLAVTEIAVHALTGDLRVTGELRADGDAVFPVGSIGETELASNAVTSLKITDGHVTSDKIASGAIATAKLQSQSVTTNKLYLDLPTERAACVTSAKRLGTCTGLVDTAGGCPCS